MAVDETSQREAKRRFVVDALLRIGRFPEGLPVDDLVAAPIQLGYRNRIELSFGRDRRGRQVLGYHRRDDPSELLDVDGCAIADPRFRAVLEVARAFFLAGAGASESAIEDPRQALRLVLRASNVRDEILVALRGVPGPFATARPFAEAASAADPRLIGVVRLLAARGRRGGVAVETVLGRSWIAHTLHRITFRVPAGTFLQVHDAAADTLGRHVLEGAGSPKSVLELYGGIGGFGMALAGRGASVTVVDADPAAIDCGAEAARAHGLTEAEFACADVLSYLKARTEGGAPELVIADPPRTGLGRGVAERLAALGPPRMVMVSCDPATLARDLADLAARGYAIDKITPFDLFPQTAHVEAVAWLSRETGARR